MRQQSQKRREILTKERIMGINKIVMSLLAVSSLYFATLNYDLSVAQKASPNLKAIAIMDSERERSGIKLSSTGLGHTIIKSVHIYDAEGNLVNNQAYSLNHHFKILDSRFDISPLQAKDTIKEGEEHWLIKSLVNTRVESRIVRDFLHSASIEICYCSLTNQCESKTIGLRKHPKTQCDND